MDKGERDQANLHVKQAGPEDVPKVNLLLQQEDRRMLKSDIVDRIHEMSSLGDEIKLRACLMRILPHVCVSRRCVPNHGE